MKSVELSISVCEIRAEILASFGKHAELWVPFWENTAKLLGGKFSINKMNVRLEMKV